MQIEPWHAHGTGPKPKFAQIWHLFVYLLSKVAKLFHEKVSSHSVPSILVAMQAPSPICFMVTHVTNFNRNDSNLGNLLMHTDPRQGLDY